jgi:hypothetical protein
MKIEKIETYKELNRIFQKSKIEIQKEFSPYFYEYIKIISLKIPRLIIMNRLEDI